MLQPLLEDTERRLLFATDASARQSRSKFLGVLDTRRSPMLLARDIFGHRYPVGVIPGAEPDWSNQPKPSQRASFALYKFHKDLTSDALRMFKGDIEEVLALGANPFPEELGTNKELVHGIRLVTWDRHVLSPVACDDDLSEADGCSLRLPFIIFFNTCSSTCCIIYRWNGNMQELRPVLLRHAGND